MKILKFPLLVCCILASSNLFSQAIPLNKNNLVPVKVTMSIEKFMDKDAVKVIKDSTVREFDAATFTKLKGIDFQNGSIEVKVLSRLLPKAPESARGFIGIAFRINDNNSNFECIYIRPTNGRSENQLRRNHSIQYFSYPEFRFERLRQEAPGEYESYADMGLKEWITLKIIVKEAQAKLYINDAKEPSLIVNDLKHGANNSGAIGFWVDLGTEGYFTDLTITKD
jgi:hypothetical protein